MVSVFFLLAGSIGAPVFAADADTKLGITQQLKGLEQKVADIQNQQKEILSNQQKILDELQVLKVHIRRRS